MAVDEVTQFAIDHHELMRRPDYLGKMDSERQVRGAGGVHSELYPTGTRQGTGGGGQCERTA